MSTRLLFVTMLAILIMACGTLSTPSLEQEPQPAPITQPEPVGATTAPTNEPAQDAVPDAAQVPPNCLGDDVSPIGQSIADEYEFTSYEEVTTWFCNGAEFEDILVALETESQTGTPAEEMLGMLADGFTWEEIWKLIGLAK